MIKTWTVGIAVLALSAAPVMAEQSVSDVSMDNNVQEICFGLLDRGCDCGDSCDCGDACCKDSCAGGCDCGNACCGRGGVLGAIEGLSLAALLGMEGSDWDVGGWTQFGYHDDQTPLSVTRNDGGSFNDVPDGLQLQQQWIYLGKEADGSRGLDWGFRADVVYGTDAQKTQSNGNPGTQFDTPWDRGIYGWAMPQLYGEIAINDLSVKIGHFYTIAGYETVAAPQNFFYSHSLSMFNAEPFTHTGVLSTYTGFEGLTLYNGWTLGWDTGFANTNSGNNYIGGFAYDLRDWVTMTFITTYGNFGFRDGGDSNSTAYSLVFDVTLTDNLQYVLQSDTVDADDLPASATNPFIENDIFSINQYLIYQYNDLISLGTRIEWFKLGGTSHYEYTSGVNLHVLNNLVIRPEYRKDWSPAGGPAGNRETTGVDMILTY